MRSRRVPRGLAALVLGAAILPACSQDFFDLEMHLGREDKTRPLAIVCEPPEAAPGDTVQVALHFYSPFPGDCTLSWQLALDFDDGEYAEASVERVLLPLSPPAPVAQGDGFLVQHFALVVPDSALRVSSALPDPVSDPAILALIRELLPLGPDELPPKELVDTYLASLDSTTLAAADSVTRAAVLGIADRFACRVRLRASLHCELDVDITRSITVRHSARLGSGNVNRNPEAEAFELLAIAHPDVAWDNHELYADQTLRFDLMPGELVDIPQHADWTYYAVLLPVRQSYDSALDGQPLREEGTFRWYYLNLGDPGDDYALMRTDSGEETEMWALDKSVRLLPRGGGQTQYRLLSCLRDARPDWEYYQFAPGLTLFAGTVRFTAP